MVLVHPQFDPRTAGRTRSATEFDVWRTLKALGATVEIVAAENDLRAFDRHLKEQQPDIVFNLLEEFRGEGVFDFHLITYLESLGIPYTGCNPRGLIVTRNKLWTMHIARAEGISAPRSASASKAAKVSESEFPLIVKFNREHASRGMTQANVVRGRSQLKNSIERLQNRFNAEVIVQKFVPGLEISVGVWGNTKPEAFEPWRLSLPSGEDIATEKVKFDPRYRRKKGIRAARWSGPESARLKKQLQSESKRLFTLFDMNGYARFDFRISEEGLPFLIDINANPCLAKTEDFASAARSEGISYPEVIQKVVQLGLKYPPRL